MQGTVRWFDRVRGFGLIRTDDERDVLVMFSAVRSLGSQVLRPGRRVDFEIAVRNGRNWATGVAGVGAPDGSRERWESGPRTDIAPVLPAAG